MPGLRWGAARKAPATNPARPRPRGETWPGNNESAIAPAVGGLFFPQNQALGIDHTGFSLGVQQKIVHVGVLNSPSYQQGARDLAELSDLAVRPEAGRAAREEDRPRADRPT